MVPSRDTLATITTRTKEGVNETANPEFVKRVRCDQLVKAWLFGSLSEEAFRGVYGSNTAHEVWNYLANKYNRVSVTRKLDLQRKLQTTHKLQKSMRTTFEDVVYKLIGFDEKLQKYNSEPEPNPHLAFNAGRGYSSRGRGQYNSRGGNRGKGYFSTRGRGFQQQFMTGQNSEYSNRPPHAKYVVNMATLLQNAIAGLIETTKLQIFLML